MKKEIRTVTDGVVQVTTADERWYGREGMNKETGLPEIQWVPSVSWIAGHYPKGTPFYRWLAEKGWDEAEAIKSAAGDKGSRVHHAIVDLLDGGTVSMDAKYAAGDEPAQELSLEEYNCLMAFGDFWTTCEPVTIAREQTVFNEAHNYAGTLDWVGMLRKPPKGLSEGPWLLDWKTGQHVWPEHELQVSAYDHAYLPAGSPILPGAVTRPRYSLGILQVGYRRNKAGWKLTPVEDKFDLFLAAQKIWAYECEGVAPLRRDYPLSVTLAPTVTP